MSCLAKNLLRKKSQDPKVRIFAGFLDVEVADRLAPFKTETPKSRENSRFWAPSDYARHPKLLQKLVGVQGDKVPLAINN